eukprot:g2823.t1
MATPHATDVAPSRTSLLTVYDDRAAKKYKDMMQSEDELQFYRADVAKLAHKLLPRLPVLDVGCGCGDILNMLLVELRNQSAAVNPGQDSDSTEATTKMFGVDVAETMLAHARKLVPSATFMVGDATSLDFADSSIGGIICTFMTHHLADDEVEAVVSEFARVAADGCPVYYCYWHGTGTMEVDHDMAVAARWLKREDAYADAIFRTAGFHKLEGRQERYEWGDMSFNMYIRKARD